jgi:predicted dehydrogenase
MGGGTAVPVKSDKAMISLEFADGSIGTVHYLANGGKAFPKERIEVFANDAVAVIDNFLSVKAYGWSGFRKLRLWRQDKGQEACAKAFVDAQREGREAPIPFDEIVEVSRVAIELATAQGRA